MYYVFQRSIRVRSKVSVLKVDMARSGINGTRCLRTLDTMEKRVSSIMSLCAVEGDLECPEVRPKDHYATYSAPVEQVFRLLIYCYLFFYYLYTLIGKC